MENVNVLDDLKRLAHVPELPECLARQNWATEMAGALANLLNEGHLTTFNHARPWVAAALQENPEIWFSPDESDEIIKARELFEILIKGREGLLTPNIQIQTICPVDEMEEGIWQLLMGCRKNLPTWARFFAEAMVAFFFANPAGFAGFAWTAVVMAAGDHGCPRLAEILIATANASVLRSANDRRTDESDWDEVSEYLSGRGSGND